MISYLIVDPREQVLRCQRWIGELRISHAYERVMPIPIVAASLIAGRRVHHGRRRLEIGGDWA